jgi:hypothetical protein
MATYYRSEDGITLAPGATLTLTTSWQNRPGVGPNQGLVLLGADPRSHQSDEVRLVVVEVGKCRNAPSHPNGTEVFYVWSVRNDSAITATFDVEQVVGQKQSGSPW